MLVALSGGPDSTALLLLLARLAGDFGWTLTAAHFDHGRRPGGRDRERRLRARVAGLGLELEAGRPTRALAASHEELRNARYAWLQETAERVGADRIATGHHRGDQAETVLFRILRGSGNRGLSGIPVRRGRLVRPLRPFRRTELAAWVEEQGMDVFDDPSNRDPRYARTRLRHGLIPALDAALEGGSPDTETGLVRLGAAAARVCRANARVARRVLSSFADGTAGEWPPELRAEALRFAARRRGVRLRRASALRAASDMLELGSGHGFDLGGGLRLERVFDHWEIRRPAVAVEPGDRLEIGGPAAGRAELYLGGRRRAIRWGPEVPGEGRGTCVALHVDDQHYPLIVRAWSPGDRIGLADGTRKVSRLLGEARVPAHERPGVPVVLDREGRLLCALRREIDGRIAREATAHANFGIEVEDG